jgi:HPt (histidine-containing phosphotransfer) domain-containing protein
VDTFLTKIPAINRLLIHCRAQRPRNLLRAYRMSTLAPPRPIDLTHLDRYTGGDAHVNAEVFRLFSQHCRETLHLLDLFVHAPQRREWREAAHGLKGAALGIGAFDLAEAAGAVEDMEAGSSHSRAAKVLRALNERAEVVLAYIDAYLAG